MNRAVAVILFLLAGLTSCKKDLQGSVEGYKAQAAKDDKIIADYLKNNPSLQATKIDTSGVYYITDKPRTGTDLFTASTQITVGYTGRLLTTQQVFAQTKNDDTSPEYHPTFILSQTIKGWQLGVPYGRKGGTIRLLIPSRYAYGPNPQPLVGPQFGLKGGLPANAVLDFEITLYDIIN